MIRIILADDDPRIRSIVREYSQAEDWTFFEAGDGEEVLTLFKEEISLVVLDVMMPKMDGWAVLKEIRKTSQVPVILLTARNEEYDRLLGFELGVDDYISKPFSPRELIARMKALLKRAGAPSSAQSEYYVVDGLSIDMQAHIVRIDGSVVALTPKEYDLLAFFASRPGIAFTRDQLLNHVWGYDYYGDARTVDTHIKSLRDKIGKYRELIVTVWGTGYRFTGGKS